MGCTHRTLLLRPVHADRDGCTAQKICPPRPHRGVDGAPRRDVTCPPHPYPAPPGRGHGSSDACMVHVRMHALQAGACACARRAWALRHAAPAVRSAGPLARGAKVRGRRTVGVTHSGPCLPARPGDRAGEMAMVLQVRGRPGLQSVPTPYDISCKCKSKALLTPPSHTKMRAVAWRAWLRARFRMAEGVACRHPPQGIQPWVSCQPTAYVLARAFTA